MPLAVPGKTQAAPGPVPGSPWGRHRQALGSARPAPAQARAPPVCGGKALGMPAWRAQRGSALGLQPCGSVPDPCQTAGSQWPSARTPRCVVLPDSKRPCIPSGSVSCTAFSEHAQAAARIPSQAAAHLPQTPGPMVPVAGCRASSPDPWTDGPEYCGWKQFCQYGGTDTEGRCNRPVSLLRLGAPPLQCWPGHAECPWREEILPVNIARGGAKTSSASDRQRAGRDAYSCQSLTNWQTCFHQPSCGVTSKHWTSTLWAWSILAAHGVGRGHARACAACAYHACTQSLRLKRANSAGH